MKRITPFLLLFLLFILCDKNSTGNEEATYRVEYNGNGHTSGTIPVDGNVYKNGDNATILPQGTLIKNSHTFNGWNTKADGTGMMYSSGSKLIIGESNITLYAQWVQLPPPSNFKATAGNQQNTITFSPVTGATKYNLYWGTTTPVSKSFTKIELTSTIYTHTSLNNGTKYYYAISSANNSTESNLSQEANATPFQSVTPPQPPTNVKATAGNGQNTITFTPAAGATKYNLYWGTTTPVTKSFTKIELGSNSYTHSNLTNGTKYYYAISSVNNLGEGNLSQQVDATPFQSVNPPQPPTNVFATAGNKQNVITFTPSTGATSHKLYWDTKPIAKTTAQSIDNIRSPYIHTPLTNGTKYYYAIIAVSSIGESGLSTEVNATPKEIIVQQGMVLIPAKGKSFMMGSLNGGDSEKPVHKVTFTYNFYMDSTEVSQASYKAILGVTPSVFKGDNLPVENCSWYDAVLYCNARSKQEGKDTVYTYTALIGTPGNGSQLQGVNIDYSKNGYRLPTEAEWEYAYRGGTTTAYYWGDQIDGDYCWYKDNADSTTHPVGTKKPNSFGLYNMGGNVTEACNDWYGEYSSIDVTDPVGPTSGNSRVFRGGNWSTSDGAVRSTYRWLISSNSNGKRLGFRSVLGVIKTSLLKPPMNVKATAGNKQNTITFTASIGATSYKLYWDTKPVNKATAKTITNITTPYVHDSLVNGTKYHYAITAINSAGESKLSQDVSSIPFQDVTPPQPPTNVKATAGDNQNTLTFTASIGATSYTLYWDTKPINKTMANTIDSLTTPFVHDFLTNGTKYYYAITAINNVGESLLSVEDSATPNEIITLPEMVLIPAKGKSFMMGSENGNSNEKPVHNVTFTYDFYMGTTEVTQISYLQLLGVNPSDSKGANLPVENCNWYDAVLYCNALSKKEGKDTIYSYSEISGTPGNKCTLSGVVIDYSKNGYRLPTEAEWEYACRGSTTTAFYWGDSMDGDYCWYWDNSGSKTHTVATKKPNVYGLYDMSGNVYEWCNDWSVSYSSDSLVDPIGPLTGYSRVLRSGSGNNDSMRCRSAFRFRLNPVNNSRFYGFRIVRAKK